MLTSNKVWEVLKSGKYLAVCVISVILIVVLLAVGFCCLLSYDAFAQNYYGNEKILATVFYVALFFCVFCMLVFQVYYSVNLFKLRKAALTEDVINATQALKFIKVAIIIDEVFFSILFGIVVLVTVILGVQLLPALIVAITALFLTPEGIIFIVWIGAFVMLGVIESLYNNGRKTVNAMMQAINENQPVKCSKISKLKANCIFFVVMDVIIAISMTVLSMYQFPMGNQMNIIIGMFALLWWSFAVGALLAAILFTQKLEAPVDDANYYY